MSWNTFGRLLRVTTFGESHGRSLGVVVDGVPPGMKLTADDVQLELDLRRPGTSSEVSQRREPDRVEIISGLFQGATTGAPVCMVVFNEEARPEDYDHLKGIYRPGHADLTYQAKYGLRDHRGGGRSSGRETVGRVAAGAIARRLLQDRDVLVSGHVVQVGSVRADGGDEETARTNSVRCRDGEAAARMKAEIERARSQNDSLGGVVEVVASNVPAGWGDPVFGKLDALLAYGLMSIGAVKGVEVGAGFGVVGMRGSEANDPILPGPTFGSNNHGGVLGGISSGADVVVRLAVKPTSSIGAPQQTVQRDGQPTVVSVKGRHDPCICPRLVPVAEAMVCLVLADAMLAQGVFGAPRRGGV